VTASRSGGASAELTIVQFWHEDPPDYIAEPLASFRRLNPAARHLVFDAASAEELIAAHRGARGVAAFRACRLPVMQADYFRYCAVHALGGVYVDADFLCLDDAARLAAGSASGVLFGRPHPLAGGLADALGWPYPVGRFGTVVNGVFAFPEPGHPLLELAIELATVNIESRLGEGATGVWLAAGPGIFTALYLLRELGSVDALVAYATQSVLAPAAPLLRQVLGDGGAVSNAFDGVEVRPLGTILDRLIVETTKPADRRPAHWAGIKTGIYR
jgi:mannosyltransferase OCH1-like enzyme